MLADGRELMATSRAWTIGGAVCQRWAEQGRSIHIPQQ